jgi:hypothetical protein
VLHQNSLVLESVTLGLEVESVVAESQYQHIALL